VPRFAMPSLIPISSPIPNPPSLKDPFLLGHESDIASCSLCLHGLHFISGFTKYFTVCFRTLSPSLHVSFTFTLRHVLFFSLSIGPKPFFESDLQVSPRLQPFEPSNSVSALCDAQIAVFAIPSSSGITITPVIHRSITISCCQWRTPRYVISSDQRCRFPYN
jgi:hypothetical protein